LADNVEAGLGLNSIPFLDGLNKAGNAMTKFMGKATAATSGLAAIIHVAGRVYHAAMNMAKILMTVGIVIAAVASVITVKALKAFAAFQRGMQEVASIIPGVLISEIEALGQSLLELTRRFGLTAESAVKASYNLVSAGFNVSQALYMVKGSAIAAIAGLTSIESAARLATAVMRAYGKSVAALANIQDTLFTTVRIGVLTFQDLVDNLGTVLPMANAAGVSLEELGAMLSLITQNGIPANEAVTALNRLITQLAAPTETAKKRLKELGIVTQDVYGNMLPLTEVLKRFKGLTLTQLRGIVGEIRGIKALLALINQPAALAGELEKMSGRSGAAMEAMNKQALTLSRSWSRMAAVFGSFWKVLGAYLEPIGFGVIKVLNLLGIRMLKWLQINKAAIVEFAESAGKKIEVFGKVMVDVFKGFKFSQIAKGARMYSGVLKLLAGVLSLTIPLLTAFAFVLAQIPVSMLLIYVAATSLAEFLSRPFGEAVRKSAKNTRDNARALLSLVVAFGKAGIAATKAANSIARGTYEGTIAVDELIEKESEYLKALRKRFVLQADARREAAKEKRMEKEIKAEPAPGTAVYEEAWKKAYETKYRLMGLTEDKIARIIQKQADDEAKIRFIQNGLMGDAIDKILDKQRHARETEKEKSIEHLRDITDARTILTLKQMKLGEKIEKLGQRWNKTAQEKARLEKFRDDRRALSLEQEVMLEAYEKRMKIITSEEASWRADESARRILAIRAASFVTREMAVKDFEEKVAMEEEHATNLQRIHEKAFSTWKSEMSDRAKFFKGRLKDMESAYEDLQKQLEQIDVSRRSWIEGHQDAAFEYTMSRSDAVTRLEMRKERAKNYVRRAMQTQVMEERRRLFDKAISQYMTLLDGEKDLTKQQREEIFANREKLVRAGAKAFEEEKKQVRDSIKTLGASILKVQTQIKSLYEFVAKNVLDIRDDGKLEGLHNKAKDFLATLRKISSEPSHGGEPKEFAVSRQHGGWIGSDNLLTRLHQGEFVVRRDAAVQNARLLESINRSKAPEASSTSLAGTFNFPGVTALDPDTIRITLIPELERFRRHRS